MMVQPKDFQIARLVGEGVAAGKPESDQ